MTPQRRPLASAPAKSVAQRTPAELAKTVIGRAEHLVGDPTRVKLKLNIVLSRTAAERLTARALEAGDTTFPEFIATILEAAAVDSPQRKIARSS